MKYNINIYQVKGCRINSIIHQSVQRVVEMGEARFVSRHAAIVGDCIVYFDPNKIPIEADNYEQAEKIAFGIMDKDHPHPRNSFFLTAE